MDPSGRRWQGEAARLGISDQLDLRGWVTKDELPEIYRSGDIFVLPSRDEGMANALLEAMAAGLPVVGDARRRHRRSRWSTAKPACWCRRRMWTASRDALMSLIIDERKRARAFGRAAGRGVEARFGWDIVAQGLGGGDGGGHRRHQPA